MKQIKDSNGKNTGSKLDHLNSVYKQTGKKPDELNLVEPDSSIIFVLDYFFDIKNCIGEKISYSELESYQKMTNVDLCSWQCAAIMQLDTIFEGSF